MENKNIGMLNDQRFARDGENNIKQWNPQSEKNRIDQDWLNKSGEGQRRTSSRGTRCIQYGRL